MLILYALHPVRKYNGYYVRTVSSGEKFLTVLSFHRDGPVRRTHGTQGAAKKVKAPKGIDLVEALDGLDALANRAILEQGEILPASSQATTKNPRHRPGCTCIVCIQPLCEDALRNCGVDHVYGYAWCSWLYSGTCLCIRAAYPAISTKKIC